VLKEAHPKRAAMCKDFEPLGVLIVENAEQGVGLAVIGGGPGLASPFWKVTSTKLGFLD
jgi:hypothetical protein